MCKSILFLCWIVVLSMFGVPALAQTPDGQTPAAEDTCDPLKGDGVTPGLYGLCVAFCEAKDYAGESSPPLDRLLANYNKRKKDTDPDMPCLPVVVADTTPPVPVPVVQACPCWTAAEADAIDGVLSDGSTAFGWPAPTNSPSVCSTDPTNLYLSETGTVNFAMERTYIRTVEQSTINRCEYQTIRNGVVVDYPLLSVEQGTLTPEQLAACKADLLARQTALNVCQ